MQYYIKIYNTTTNELVGFYKEGSRNCISKIQNGMKYFNNIESALRVLNDIDDGFVRDKDKHYYKGHAIIYGDNTRVSNENKSSYEKEEELKDALNTFIRKNSNKTR